MRDTDGSPNFKFLEEHIKITIDNQTEISKVVLNFIRTPLQIYRFKENTDDFKILMNFSKQSDSVKFGEISMAIKSEAETCTFTLQFTSSSSKGLTDDDSKKKTLEETIPLGQMIQSHEPSFSLSRKC